ncbi:uncharacterized protein LOC114254406 [Monomorium pharaonis]|uniref:uncharacterized protein LOC114254406 n=1 Tax=Monomorium pharaonis TaxID=307658 RepID=UPI00102E1CFE|nr:uncharacterized protein LOC114254406 [Monomorium pharaonis]
MYIFKDEKFNRRQKLNEILLRLLGLWPYEKTKCERFRAMCCFVILISHIITELAQLIIVDFNANVITRILSDTLPTTLCFINFNMIFFGTKELKQLLEEVINTRQMLTDAQEIKILEYYAHQAEKFPIIIIPLQAFTILSLLIMELLPDILDFLRPLNESRAHYLIVMNEYDINEGIQFYSFLLYTISGIIIGTSTIIFVISTILSICLHCCALYKICSYRIKQFVDKEIIASFNKRNIIVERIIRIVELHIKAKKLSKMIVTSFTISYLSMLVIGMCGFAMRLYRLLYIITYTHDSVELLIEAAYVIGCEFTLLTISFIGQLMINHSDEIFNTL